MSGQELLTAGNPILSDRIQSLDLSIMRKIAELSLQHDVIHLDGGAPDFPSPAVIKKAAAEAIFADYNQYAPLQGIEELRQGIARRYREKHAIRLDPQSEITVCCGATEAISASLLAIVNPGDEVIVLEPAFGLYASSIVLAGGRPVRIPLHPPEFRIDGDALEAAVSPRTKAIIFNSPHNPSGKVYDQEELFVLAEFCLRHNVIAITDEIYDEILFDQVTNEKLWKIPGMRERTIVVNGFSKTYSVTGWRLGYVVAPPAITRGILIAHNYLTVGAPAPLQVAAVAATQLPESYYRDLANLLQQRRDVLQAGLEQLGFRCLPSHGGYFLLAESSYFGWKDDFDFVKHLIQNIGVAAVPLSGFYQKYPQEDGVFLRFAFCKKEETLRTALQRLQQLTSRIRSERRQ